MVRSCLQLSHDDNHIYNDKAAAVTFFWTFVINEYIWVQLQRGLKTAGLSKVVLFLIVIMFATTQEPRIQTKNWNISSQEFYLRMIVSQVENILPLCIESSAALHGCELTSNNAVSVHVTIEPSCMYIYIICMIDILKCNNLKNYINKKLIYKTCTDFTV